MVIPTWDQLQKNQTDSETIESAISRLIEDHNNDPTAHLGAGQSLQSHKASAIIDHLAESIVQDKLAPFSLDYALFTNSKFQIICNFESVDGLNFFTNNDGSYAHKLGALLLNSGVGVGHGECVSAWPSAGGGPSVNWAKNPVLQVVAIQPAGVNCDFYILIAPTQVPPFNGDGCGFKISGGSLYFGVAPHATVWTWTPIYGFFNFHNTNVYKIEVTSGVGIKLYLNGVLVYTYTGAIPTGSYAQPFTACVVSQTAGGNETLVLTHMLYQQDL